MAMAVSSVWRHGGVRNCALRDQRTRNFGVNEKSFSEGIAAAEAM
jgi:hypothetical protein